MSRRYIIVHFHFFKNAGSSVEFALEQHFGDRFTRFEPGGPTDTFPATVLGSMLDENEKLQAVSSHTVCFPPPTRPEWSVFPVVFLRHPLDRIVSMYNYERKQHAGDAGAATIDDPGAYIESRLETPYEHTLRNYQAWMMAGAPEDQCDDEALFRAAANAVNRLPVVGVVNEFAESVRRLTEWLSPCFPGLELNPVRQNRTSPAWSNMEGRIKGLRDCIGSSLFERLESENAVDFELYRLARESLGV